MCKLFNREGGQRFDHQTCVCTSALKPSSSGTSLHTVTENKDDSVMKMRLHDAIFFFFFFCCPAWCPGGGTEF